MKRLFTYILALSLLPQIASAATVGKTEGTFAVSPKGAATYTIPLTVPKGMSDFKPELSLFYDSNAENGIMGLGWNIKGLHTISKVNKCQHFDGTSQGKAYALDGMRMILAVGADGQTGAIYKTEHDQGDIISITATHNGAPATFKVKASDGSIYIYGSSTGRYINGVNSMWALDYAQDALGNYISYTYEQDGGLYPTTITYGRNIHGTAGVTCTISFTYDNSTTKRLQRIECKYNGSIYRSYSFGYADSPSRVISITEGGRASSSTFAPTTFEWEQNRIVSITDGLGATESYNYCNLSGNDIYSQGLPFSANSSVYRLEYRAHADMLSNIYVVQSRTESIPTYSRTTNYFYTRGIYHKNGKGFLGFGEIEEIKSTGVKSIADYEVNTKYAVLLPNEVNLYSDSEYEHRQKWDWNTIEIENVDDVTYRTRVISNGTHSNADGFGNSYELHYENGLPSMSSHSDGFIEIMDNTITYWESSNDTVGIKGLPTVTQTRKLPYFSDGADPIFETTTYVRDNNTGLVTKKTKQRGGDTVSTDGYSYNEYGQVTRHYTVAYNSTDTLVTTYQYNSKGQLYKEYNPMGQCKTYSYISSSGAVSRIVDFDGSATTYSYDMMNRETKCSGPSNTITTTRNSSNYGGSVYYVKVNATDKNPVTTYYDAWGRKVAELTTCTLGANVYTEYKYNSIGKIGFVSFPHKSNETDTLGTNYYYDDYMHWLVRTEDSNGKVNTWNYNYNDEGEDAFDYISCIDGVTTTTNYLRPDVIGDITYDDESNVHYAYNGDGNILKAVATFKSSGSSSQTIETNYEYDVFGRLVRTIDMNGVTKQYEYDANGYPKKTTIGGSTVITNYDKYGRLLSKSWSAPDGDSHTVTYTYNTALNKKHLVATEQGDNYTYTYTYDTNGKLTNKRHSVTGDTQTHYADIAIQYNSDNQISKKTCTLSIGNKNLEEAFTYRNGGLLVDSLNHNIAWKVNRQDKWGNVTGDRGAVGNAGEYSFDDYGHVLSVWNSKVTERSYTYDIETANMIEENGISLTYDDKNRLIEWGDHAYEYDKMGNITYQPLVGTFTYKNFKVDSMEVATEYIADDSLCISYYQAFERPKRIENKHYKAEFSYDGEGNRVLLQVYKKVSGQYQPYLTRFYLDKNIEVNVDSLGKKKGYYYAGDDAQTALALIMVQGSNYLSWKMVRDNVGNVIAYAKAANPSHEFSYSPWGVRTAMDDVTDFSMPGESLGDCPFYRTHKGYEDLWMFGLQFDKTRLYSPYMGRYLSPNPEYTITGGPFDHNPYVFSGNNPFRVVK